MMKKMRTVLFCSVLLSFLASCDKPKKTQTEEQTNDCDTCVTKGKTDKFEIVSPESSMMLMDVSVSMKGYIGSGDPRLKGVIASYLNISKNEPTISLFGEKEERPISKDVFLNKLNDKASISWSHESDLKGMLKSMVNHCKTHNVSFLLTDGILSGSNAQISKSPDRKFNIENREWLSSEIKNIFKSNDSLSAIIVRYKANFNGTYSCYNNDSKSINKERPYYVVAIGKWAYIKYLERELVNSKSKVLDKPYEDYAMFGDEVTYNKLKFSYNSGVKELDKEGYMIIKSDVRKEGDVILTTDVTILPSYMQNPIYWNNNIELSIRKKGENGKDLSKDIYEITVDPKTCKITIPAYMLTKRELNIKLRYDIPSWINEYTDENDLNIASDISKMSQTFNLKYFAEGLSSLQNSENVINQTIKFK